MTSSAKPIKDAYDSDDLGSPCITLMYVGHFERQLIRTCHDRKKLQIFSHN